MVPESRAGQQLKRIALIGCGGIALDIVTAVKRRPLEIPLQITGALARPATLEEACVRLNGVTVSCDIKAILAPGVDLVVEVASQAAVREYGDTILRSGVDLMIVSVGALADEVLLTRLKDAAIRGQSQIIVPPGAMGAIDILAAHRLGGLHRVVYRSIKPIAAWLGTRAVELVDLEKLVTPKVFFSGDARNATTIFPQNANVAATIALAGVGFDNTIVELVADPTTKCNRHELHFESEIGRVDTSFESIASKSNPKTSALTALSVLRSLMNQCSWLRI
jgi:aspartate dehydrogenase